jgi:hypothetical protein
VFDWGVGDRMILYLHIGDKIMVWLGGREARQTRFWVRELGSVSQNNLNLEALKFWQRFVFTQPLTKTVSKHVTGYHGDSI